MKIAIIGCGAMGSVYAGLLATVGHEVLAVDRSAAHVAAIMRSGLRVEGASGDRTVRLKAYQDAPHDVVDLVVIATKAAAARDAARAAVRMIGPRTVVLTIQNGIGSAQDVAEEVGADRLMVGIAAAFGASISGPGHVRHEGMAAVKMGAFSCMQPEAIQEVVQAWKLAGFNAESVSDIRAMQWEKLICNTAYSGPCGLSGMRVGEVMNDPDLSAVSQAAATEAFAVARALGVALQFDDPVRLVLDFGARVAGAKPSVLLDLERGRPTEIEFISGIVAKYGREAGVPAPVNATLTALVKARERRSAV